MRAERAAPPPGSQTHRLPTETGQTFASAVSLPDKSIEKTAEPNEGYRVAIERKIGLGQHHQINHHKQIVDRQHDKAQRAPQQKVRSTAKIRSHQEHCTERAREEAKHINGGRTYRHAVSLLSGMRRKKS